MAGTGKRYSQLTVFNLTLAFAIIVFHHAVEPYELKLDKEEDRVLWKFKGHYLYTQSSDDLEDLLNTGSFPVRMRTSNSAPVTSDDTNLQLPQNGVFDNTSNIRNGIWFTRNLPKRQNTLSLSYALKHALFTQGWISFYGTPKVEVKIKTNQGQQIAQFWNDGQNWCDAVVSMGLKTTFTLEVATSEPGDYFLLDKIILGIFSNVSQLNGRRLNPCLTSPLNETNIPASKTGEDKLQNTDSRSQPAALPQTLSRQSRDFSHNGSEKNNTGSQDNYSPLLNGNEDKMNTSNHVSFTVQGVLSPNRQSRSSNMKMSQTSPSPSSSSSSPPSNESEDGARLSPASNIDLKVEIPVTSRILESVKGLNKSLSSSSSQSLQCTCSCSSPLL